MNHLTESSLLADRSSDPRANGWITDNLLHPFINGTGVAQLYNNFVSDKNKAAPEYVPEAKTLSTDWAIHSLASASGALITYAVAGKAAGMGLSALSSAAGLEGATARALTSVGTAQIVGAGLLDFAKAPNPGETRLGNAAGSVAAFGLFSAGNSMLASSKTIAESSMLTGLGRIGVGMAGGLTSIESSHLVSSALGVKSDINWQDRMKAMAGSGFINFAMPIIQPRVSAIVDGAIESFKHPAVDDFSANLALQSTRQLPQMQIDDSNKAKGATGDEPAKTINASTKEAVDYAIHTTIVTDDGPKLGWLEIRGDKIVGIADDASRSPAKNEIEFDGFAYPGLIDTHNHVDWNAISRWSAGHPWSNRYEWQEDVNYMSKVNSPHANRLGGTDYSLDSRRVEATAYGELRALTGGTTMIQSSFSKSMPEDVVIRQLGPNYKADAWTLDVARMPEEVHKSLLDGMDSGRLNRTFFHVAEGQKTDAETGTEFETLRKAGFIRPGTVVIHGVGLTPENFAEMKANNMYLVWSPESNLNLYDQTTDVKAAKAAGLTIALAPDWSITGSNNALEELTVASNFAKANHMQDVFTPKELFQMVTSKAAEVAGVGDILGHLAPNYGADVLLLAKNNPDPYANLIQSNVSDVSLVFVKGKPLYGDMNMLKPLAPNAEEINVADLTKGLNTEATALKRPMSAVIADLHKAIPQMAPLNEK